MSLALSDFLAVIPDASSLLRMLFAPDGETRATQGTVWNAVQSNPGIALRLACSIKESTLDKVWEFVSDQPDVRQALAKTAWLFPLGAPRLRLRFYVEGSTAHIEFSNHAPAATMTIGQIITWRCFTRKFPSLEATEVVIPGNLSGAVREYENFFGCPARAEGKIQRISFPAEQLNLQAVRREPRDLNEEAAMRKNAVTGDALNTIEVLYRNAVVRGLSRPSDVAALLGWTERGLKSALAKTFMNHRSALDDARRHYVLAELSRNRTPLAELARQAGFAHGSALTRAVRGWTGLAPSEYRARYYGHPLPPSLHASKQPSHSGEYQPSPTDPQ